MNFKDEYQKSFSEIKADENFKKNVSFLCSLGFNKDDITEFVVRGCYGIGSVSFDEAFSFDLASSLSAVLEGSFVL